MSLKKDFFSPAFCLLSADKTVKKSSHVDIWQNREEKVK